MINRIIAFAVVVCVALCLTLGIFAAYMTIRDGSGFWLPVVLLAPPLTVIGCLYWPERV